VLIFFIASIASSNQVSWQSAYWAIIACLVTIMMQISGKVCGAPLRYSVALRSSIVLCAIDTLLILVEFVWMLAVGCSIRVAARHVWYDRFAITKDDLDNRLALLDLFDIRTPRSERGNTSGHIRSDQIEFLHSLLLRKTENVLADLPYSPPRPETENNLDALSSLVLPVSAPRKEWYPGSGIGRGWRLSMLAFAVGAFPQMVKVFGMKGIPLTQTMTSIIFASFLVSEMLRLIAGPAGKVELYPSTAVLKAKIHIDWLQRLLFRNLFRCQIGFNLCMVTIPLLSTEFFWASMTVVPVTLATVMTGRIFRTLRIAESNSASSITRGFEIFLSKISDAYSIFLSILTKTFALNDIHEDLNSNSLVLFVLTETAILLFLDRTGYIEKGNTLLQNHYIKGGPMVASIICISSIGVISSFLLIGPFIILMSHLIYRLLFIGSLSKYPRKLSGVDGSLSSFICMLFMFSNFYSLCYAFHFYFDSEHNTYKPDWAEYLG
jgi:hypothetical protein